MAITPALQAWVEARASEFVSEQGALDFFVLLRRPSEIQAALEAGEVQLAVAATPPTTDGFITPLGIEPIVLIVHPENPLTSLSSAEIAQIFNGRTYNWDQVGGDPQPIQPYLPLPGDEARDLFASQLLEGARLTTNAILAPSPHAMRGAVAEDAGGIGLLPLSGVDTSVKMIALDGHLPDSTSPPPDAYPLRLEVLAFAPVEPVGALRTWLGWVQARDLEADRENK
jgi:DNA-binding transcriptional LysR family regulator